MPGVAVVQSEWGAWTYCECVQGVGVCACTRGKIFHLVLLFYCKGITPPFRGSAMVEAQGAGHTSMTLHCRLRCSKMARAA